jgi:hypothetical protein
MMMPTENLSTDTASVADSLSAMIQKELTTYCHHDGYLDPSDPTIITPDDRMALVDWCYGVVDHCQFSRESVASAMEMVDRFLSIPSQLTHEALHDRKVFQLITIVALYISIKIHEPASIGSSFFSDMSRGAYTVETIEDMELILLAGLSWRCNAPTASQVGFHILSLIMPKAPNLPESAWCFLMDEMKYQTEHAVRDYYFTTQRPSTIALAAIMNASSELDFKLRQEITEALGSIFAEADFAFEDVDRLLLHKKKLASLVVEGDAADDTIDNDNINHLVEESGDTLVIDTSNRSWNSRTSTTCKDVDIDRTNANPSPNLVHEALI